MSKPSTLNSLNQFLYEELFKSNKVAASGQLILAVMTTVSFYADYGNHFLFQISLCSVVFVNIVRVVISFLPQIPSQRWLKLFSTLIFLTSLGWSLFFYFTALQSEMDKSMMALTFLGPMGLAGSSYLAISISRRDLNLFQIPLLLSLMTSFYLLFGLTTPTFLGTFMIVLFWVYGMTGKKKWYETWTNMHLFNHELQTVIDSIPGGISVVCDGRYVQLNAYFTAALNFSIQEHLHKPVGYMYPDSDFTKKLIHFSQSKEEKAEFEIIIPTQAGERAHHVIFKKFKVPDYKEQIIISSFDIDDLKTAHTEIERQKNQIEYSAKMASLGEMSSGVAHEINNPLAVISARAQILKQELEAGTFTDEKGLKGIDSILGMSDRITKIIKSLKLFARDSSKDSFEITSLSKIISETIDLCEVRSAVNEIRIIKEGLDPDILLECSPTQISQVLLNAFNNSFDAIMALESRWIKIVCYSDGVQVHLEVIDSGSGIEKKIQGDVMRPFFTTKPAGQGTGLGLSVSKRIIENHGGYIDFDHSSVHTKLIITLPLKQQAQQNSKLRLAG